MGRQISGRCMMIHPIPPPVPIVTSKIAQSVRAAKKGQPPGPIRSLVSEASGQLERMMRSLPALW
jgi:hypothetical protein